MTYLQLVTQDPSYIANIVNAKLTEINSIDTKEKLGRIPMLVHQFSMLFNSLTFGTPHY